MKKMGKYLKYFVLKGLVAMGFGPIVLAVIYSTLGITGTVSAVGVGEMVQGILTISALAFVAGGITVVYQIEELAISKAITMHGIILYICYAVVYLVNGWLAKGVVPFMIFTVIFILGYLLVWLIIYFTTRKSTRILNNKLKNRAE